MALTPRSSAQDFICDDTIEKNKPVCECNESVCYFKFVIEHLQTFTAYEKEAPYGTRGRVFFIDKYGNLLPTRQNSDSTACNNRSYCTDPNTVDGSTYRSSIAVNKQIPGPTLIVNETATVVVDIVNLLTTEETSFHWHGMHSLDGRITQCPIEAGASFLYIFKAMPAGTTLTVVLSELMVYLVP